MGRETNRNESMEAGPSKQNSKYPHDPNKFRRKPKADAHKQYIGSRDTGQGFADSRKRKAKFEYLKLLKKESRKKDETGNEASQHKFQNPLFRQNELKNKKKKTHSFWTAEKVAQNRKKQKQEEKERRLEVKTDKQKALATYKSKKQAQHLKLCKRTQRGQPVMKLQMEVLLDKIKRQKGLD